MSELIKHHRQLLGIAKSWAVKHLPGWSEACHRDLLMRYGATNVDGRISATTMSVVGMSEALADYERRGWARRKEFQSAGATQKITPTIKHIVRLWGRLAQSGKVKNASRAALLSFCARQTARDIPNLDALSVKESQAVIEALKAWSGRSQ